MLWWRWRYTMSNLQTQHLLHTAWRKGEGQWSNLVRRSLSWSGLRLFSQKREPPLNFLQTLSLGECKVFVNLCFSHRGAVTFLNLILGAICHSYESKALRPWLAVLMSIMCIHSGLTLSLPPSAKEKKINNTKGT